MSIRVRRQKSDEDILQFADADALLKAIQDDEVSGRDEYFAPGENDWFELDSHPQFSTTDARGIYPAIVHLVVFIKIFVFVGFLSLLEGKPEIMTHAGAIYVYVVMVGDLACILLAYMNRNRLAAWLLWILGIVTMPLGLFLVIAANLTRKFQLRPAE